MFTKFKNQLIEINKNSTSNVIKFLITDEKLLD